MLSRVMNRGLIRGAGQMSKMIQPGTYVCFCGSTSPMHQCKGTGMTTLSRRNFQGHLGLDSTVDLVPAEYKAADQVSMWKDVKAKQENSLVLKTNDEIE